MLVRMDLWFLRGAPTDKLRSAPTKGLRIASRSLLGHRLEPLNALIQWRMGTGAHRDQGTGLSRTSGKRIQFGIVVNPHLRHGRKAGTFCKSEHISRPPID